MPAASQTSFDVHYGLALLKPARVSRIVTAPARRQGKIWAMSRLSDAIRRGDLRSAWGDMDEPDSTGLGFRGDVVPSAAEIDQRDRVRLELLERERQRAKDAQDEIINKAIEKQRQQAADRAQNELEELEGYGTF